MDDAVVKLNVGGQRFDVASSTLLKEEGSFFSSLLAGRLPSHRIEGAYFLDRDPEAFTYILRYLRHGSVTVPKHLQELVAREADFYLITLKYDEDPIPEKSVQEIDKGVYYNPREGSIRFFQDGMLHNGANRLVCDTKVTERGGFLYWGEKMFGEISVSGEVLRLEGEKYRFYRMVFPDTKSSILWIGGRHKIHFNFSDSATCMVSTPHHKSFTQADVESKGGVFQVGFSPANLLSRVLRLVYISKGRFTWRLETSPSNPAYKIDFGEEQEFPFSVVVRFISLGNNSTRLLSCCVEELPNKEDFFAGKYQPVALRGIHPPGITPTEVYREILTELKAFILA